MAVIITKKDDEFPVSIVIASIVCSSNDEASIQYTIETHKNDPNIVLGIILKGIPKEKIVEIKPALDHIKNDIEQCESITVRFIDLTEIEKFIKEQMAHTRFDFCLN